MIHFSNEVWQSMAHLSWISVALWVGVNIAGWSWEAGINYVNENTKATNPCPWFKWFGVYESFFYFLITLTGVLIVPFVPFIVLGLISIYPVPLFILTTYGALRLARGAKRISRKLTAHTVDPEAHKNA